MNASHLCLAYTGEEFSHRLGPVADLRNHRSSSSYRPRATIQITFFASPAVRNAVRWKPCLASHVVDHGPRHSVLFLSAPGARSTPQGHKSPLSRLHGRQSIWQFSAMVLPPLDHGTMWSPCISPMSNTCRPSSLPGVRQRVPLAHL